MKAIQDRVGGSLGWRWGIGIPQLAISG